MSNTSLEFVGLPAAVGDEAFVSYYTADKKLYMGGFRAADGEQLWSTIAGASYVGTGNWFEPAVRTEPEGQARVAIVTPPDSDGWSVLRELDALTGEEQRSAYYIWAQSRPFVCEETFCVVGTVEHQDKRTWALGDGAFVKRSSGNSPENTKPIGRLMFNTNHRPDATSGPKGQELIGLAENGEVVWTRPNEDVFGEGATWDSGGRWVWERDSGPLVGTNGPAVDRNGAPYSMVQPIVGLDCSTGATLWARDDGIGCNKTPEEATSVSCGWAR